MPLKSFLKSIYKKSPNKMRANWELSKTFKVGDVGKLENGTFVPYTSLNAKGIPVDVRFGSKERGKLDLSSESGVVINQHFKAKGDAQVIELDGEAAFVIEFKKANTYIFRADGVQTNFIENLETVEKEVKTLQDKGEWDPGYVIISDIMIADAVTILLAGEAGVTTTLSADGKFNISQLDIADASVGFHVSSTNKLALEVVGRKGTTPLFKVKGLRKPILGLIGEASLVGKGKESTEDSAESAAKTPLKLIDIPFEEEELPSE